MDVEQTGEKEFIVSYPNAVEGGNVNKDNHEALGPGDTLNCQGQSYKIKTIEPAETAPMAYRVTVE